MRLTDLTGFLPDTVLDVAGIEDKSIPLDELMAIGAGCSSAAAVMWLMAHPERPALKGAIEVGGEAKDLAMETLQQLSENISTMTSDQIAAGAEVLKVLAPLGLLK